MIDPTLTQEILKKLTRIDRLQGAWSRGHPLPDDRLARLQEASCIQSVAASCRLAGIRTSEAEVADVLGSTTPPQREAVELVGYARGLATRLPTTSEVLAGRDLQSLHATMCGEPEPFPWRSAPLHREEFDAAGKATGRVFSTLPPRLVEPRTEELVTWLEFELRAAEKHPVLVVGTFVLFLLSISPFSRGNGRLSRLLASTLLARAGYGFMPYASLEAVTEQLREDYYQTMDVGQTRIWTEQANILPWTEFFVEAVDRHRASIESKINLERDVLEFPPLQQAILQVISDHGSVDAGLLLKATGANRNTLKDNLRRMVRAGVLNKTGQRRGTRYQLPGVETVAGPAPTDKLGH